MLGRICNPTTMSMRICNAGKSGFLDARAVSGIVNALIRYRRIANPTKRLSGERAEISAGCRAENMWAQF